MTDDAPLVSLLVPAFNHGRYIQTCLDSALKDGYPNLELIVLDDGSIDDTYERAAAWGETHQGGLTSFSLLRQHNRGLTPTLNRLVAKAQGTFVTFLASDDLLLPGGIKARVDYLIAHPELLAVFADCIVVDEKGRTVHSSGLSGLHRANRRALMDPRFMRRELLLRWTVPGPVFLARREAYNESKGVGRYDEGMIVEDRDYYCRLLVQRALGFLDVSVSAYRVHGANMCRAPDIPYYHSVALAERLNALRFHGLDRAILVLRSYRFCAKIFRMTRRELVFRALGLAAERGLYRALRTLRLLHDLGFAGHRMRAGIVARIQGFAGPR